MNKSGCGKCITMHVNGPPSPLPLLQTNPNILPPQTNNYYSQSIHVLLCWFLIRIFSTFTVIFTFVMSPNVVLGHVILLGCQLWEQRTRMVQLQPQDWSLDPISKVSTPKVNKCPIMILSYLDPELSEDNWITSGRCQISPVLIDCWLNVNEKLVMKRLDVWRD